LIWIPDSGTSSFPVVDRVISFVQLSSWRGPEGIWEDKGWGCFDTVGFLEGESVSANGRETGE
jgi:hypothetical protein